MGLRMTLQNVPPDLGAPERRTLLAAGELAETVTPVTGFVPGGMSALVAAVGRHRNNVRLAVDELVRRRLMRRRGCTTAVTLVVVELDARLHRTPRHTGSGGSAPSGKTKDPEWRADRASKGGVVRALHAAQQRADRYQAENEQLRKEIRRGRDPSTVRLFAEAPHRWDCTDPNCARCLAFIRSLEAKRAELMTEAELADTLGRAMALNTAAVELIAAARDHGPGSAQRKRDAWNALQAAAGQS